MNTTNNNENNYKISDILEGFVKLNLDDTFKFHCTECGKCCKHRNDILLTARDVYNMSKELNISITGLISEYCDVYLGQDSRIPIVRILPRGNVERCPFLKSNKCLVHKAKPTICAMFPVGRCLLLEEIKTQYILSKIECGDDSKTYTLREWLRLFKNNIKMIEKILKGFD